VWISELFYCNRLFPHGLFFGFLELELELELEQKYSSSYLALSELSLLWIVVNFRTRRLHDHQFNNNYLCYVL
jgi:hypothetical protein